MMFLILALSQGPLKIALPHFPTVSAAIPMCLPAPNLSGNSRDLNKTGFHVFQEQFKQAGDIGTPMVQSLSSPSGPSLQCHLMHLVKTGPPPPSSGSTLGREREEEGQQCPLTDGNLSCTHHFCSHPTNLVTCLMELPYGRWASTCSLWLAWHSAHTKLVTKSKGW